MKNQPTINGAIRLGGTVYKAGDEEALGKAIESMGHDNARATVSRLVDQGVLTGIELPKADDSEKTSEGAEDKSADKKNATTDKTTSKTEDDKGK